MRRPCELPAANQTGSFTAESKRRSDGPALGRAPFGGLPASGFLQHSGAEETFHQRQHPPVGHALCQRPPAKPEAWERWGGPRPLIILDRTSLARSCIISSRSYIRSLCSFRVFIRSVCFAPALSVRPRNQLLTRASVHHSYHHVRSPPPIFPELSNYGSLPGKAGGFSDCFNPNSEVER